MLMHEESGCAGIWRISGSDQIKSSSMRGKEGYSWSCFYSFMAYQHSVFNHVPVLNSSCHRSVEKQTGWQNWKRLKIDHHKWIKNNRLRSIIMTLAAPKQFLFVPYCFKSWQRKSPWYRGFENLSEINVLSRLHCGQLLRHRHNHARLDVCHWRLGVLCLCKFCHWSDQALCRHGIHVAFSDLL